MMDNQLWLRIKFKIKHLFDSFLDSDFVGNSIVVFLSAVCIMLALSLKFKIGLNLFLASVGIYFVAEELMGRVDKWFRNFGSGNKQ